MLSRRLLLASAAPLALMAIGVGGCVTNPTTGQPELDPTVIDAIQNAVATVAQYIPSVESIAETAAALFGPGYASIVEIGSAAINTLVSALESAVSNLTTSARLRLRARLKASAPTNAVNIGTVTVQTSSGPTTITVTGYHV